MIKPSALFLAAIVIIGSGCWQKETESEKVTSDVPANLVLIKGGTFVNTKSNLFGKNASIHDFYLGKYETTQKEWIEIMGSNPSKFKGDSLPVENVSWYDCVEYCNKRSLKEGLKPYYNIDKNTKDPNNKTDLDDIKWTITFNDGASGYRLPTEAEWEYAACGGQMSKSYTYSGSDDVNPVAWYWQNSGDKPLAGIWSWSVVANNHNQTKPGGRRAPNELGLYDLSGNVREWCEDWYQDQETRTGISRVWRGGGWMGADLSCTSAFRGNLQANGKGPDQGLRVCRSK